MAKEFRETGGTSANAVIGDGNQQLLEGAGQLDEIIDISERAGFAHRPGAGPEYHATDEGSVVRLSNSDNSGSEEYLIGTTARINHEGEDSPKLPYGTTVKIKAMPRGKKYSWIREDVGPVESVYASETVRVDRPNGAVKQLTGERAVRANEILVKRAARKIGEATVSRATSVAEEAQALLNKE